jgi:hypothetical protein
LIIIKIVFLDVDGVLNTERYLVEQCDRNQEGKMYAFEAQFNFDPRALDNLKKIVNTFDASIVISSTWRVTDKEFDLWKLDGGIYGGNKKFRYWNELIRNLYEYGLDKRVIGVTPSLCTPSEGGYSRYVSRGEEIKAWLTTNVSLKIESFVIIDDDTDMLDMADTNLAWCDGEDGINDTVRNRAMMILKKGSRFVG